MHCHLALMVSKHSSIVALLRTVPGNVRSGTGQEFADLDALEATLRRGMGAKQGNNNLPRFTLE